ncbi:MAG: HesA/MoeB/ThiF family protein, partial [Chloroflexota bacterium]
VIHTDDRTGMPKVFSAEIAMKAQNPAVEVRPYNRRLDAEIAEALFADYDLILDGTDNFETRYLVNRAAFATGKPLIAAALSQWEGQISVYAPREGTPCYACIFPEAPAPGLAPSCAEAGVLGPLPGVVGAMMAVEAVKEIAGAGDSLRGRMLIYDAPIVFTIRLDQYNLVRPGNVASGRPNRAGAAYAGHSFPPGEYARGRGQTSRPLLSAYGVRPLPGRSADEE